MKFIADKLAKGHQYPCSVREMKSWLASLPKEDWSGIETIRLSNAVHSDRSDAMYTNGNKITLFIFTNSRLEQPISGTPSRGRQTEWAKFSGKFTAGSEENFIAWPDAERLKQYVRHVFFHEVGHHVFRIRRLGGNKSGTNAGLSSQEKFASDYAARFANGAP